MQRNITLDIMKGLGVLLIVFEHCTPIGFEYKRITMSFLMPMFFIVGGYLFHPAQNIWKELKKSAKRLVLPYIAGVIIMVLIHTYVWHDMHLSDGLYLLLSAAGVEHYSCLYMPDWKCVGAFWFFMAMFWCRIIFSGIYKLAAKWKYLVLTIVAIGGYLLLRYIIRLPLGISEGLSMMIFYMAGHLFRKAQERYEQFNDNTRHYIDITMTVTVLLLFCLWSWTIKNSWMVCSAGHYEHHLLNILGACGMTYMYYWLCKGIAQYAPLMTRIFSFAGCGSLFLLWIHKLSLHYIFVWPSILNISLQQDSSLHIAIFLCAQWIVCLGFLLIVSQSTILSDFFGIYNNHNTPHNSISV